MANGGDEIVLCLRNSNNESVYAIGCNEVNKLSKLAYVMAALLLSCGCMKAASEINGGA
jgi:hypothetical protein